MTESHSYNNLTLDGLAALLRNRAKRKARGDPKVKGTKTAVLLGAGASRTAGIPLADEIVQEVCREFPDLVVGCNPSYAAHMARLASADITNLLRKYIDDAAVNGAHLFLAQLVKAGYVDRVLTTNFDSLAAQALLLVNERPFVYDLANLKLFKPGQVTSPAVIHLHGQFGGFVNLNTDAEFRTLGDLVREVLRDTLAERALIVVGYGGRNDPVFEQLCEYGKQYGEYPNGLVWVSHKDVDPPEHVRDSLLIDIARRAYYLRDYDADSFFISLARALDAGLPQIVERPFSFLKDTVRKIGYQDAAGANEGLIHATRKLIQFAIDCHEAGMPCARGLEDQAMRTAVRIEKAAQDIRAGGRIDGIDCVLKEAQEHGVLSAITDLAWTLTKHADSLLKKARDEPIPQAVASAREAVRCYRRVGDEMTQLREAHCHCGDALVFLAGLEDQVESEDSFGRAFECYGRATQMDGLGQEEYVPFDSTIETVDMDPPVPDIVPRAYKRWGDALVVFASNKFGEERRKMLREAVEKYRYAIHMRPHWSETEETDRARRVAAEQLHAADDGRSGDVA